MVDLVEKPNILVGKFDASFLNIPKEILINSMQLHQKYFPLFDQKGDLTNTFIIVTNLQDKKGLIKIGNERVISARLSDAKFFWEKNKNQSLIKQVNKLKSINFFSKLGTVFHKVQRIRKLSSMIADQFNLNKEKAITIAIESGIQNATVGITIGNLILNQEIGLSILSLPSGVYGILMYLVCLPFVFWFLKNNY